MYYTAPINTQILQSCSHARTVMRRDPTALSGPAADLGAEGEAFLQSSTRALPTMPPVICEFRPPESVLQERLQPWCPGGAHDGRSAATRGPIVTKLPRPLSGVWAQLPLDDLVTVLVTPTPDGPVLDSSSSSPGRLPQTPQAREGEDGQSKSGPLLLRVTGLYKYGQHLQSSVRPQLLRVSDNGLRHAPMLGLDHPVDPPQVLQSPYRAVAPRIYDRDLPLVKRARKYPSSNLELSNPCCMAASVPNARM